MFKLFINILIVIGLVVFKISFLNTLPIFNILNPVIIFIIFLAITNNKHYIIMAFVAGYLLDLYSHYTFGINILSLTSVAIISNYVYTSVLTSHRFLPLIFLFFINILLFHSIAIFTISILSFLKISPPSNLINLETLKIITSEAFYTGAIIAIFYLINNFLQKKFSGIFLK